MINLDDIRGKLATKYNFVFGKDDPSLATVALFEAALEQSIIDLNTKQETNQKALISAMQQGLAEGQKTAKRIVTEGAALVSDQVHVAVTSAMTESEERIKKTLNRHLEVMNDMNKDVRVSRNVSIVAAGISVICTFITLSAMAAAIT